MPTRYKIPVSMLRDYDIVLPNGNEVRLQDLVDGYVDVVNSIGSANDIHQQTGSPMEICELWATIMSQLYPHSG